MYFPASITFIFALFLAYFAQMRRAPLSCDFTQVTRVWLYNMYKVCYYYLDDTMLVF